VSNVEVKICLLHPDAKMPAYAKPGDSGMDVCTTQDITLYPLEAVKIRTGVAFGLPGGYEIQVRPKSGYSARSILCAWGTCDEQYLGEVMVVLTLIAPPDSPPVQILKGQKVAQLVLAKVAHAELVSVKTQAELGETERGTAGWGSTGL
jgi:dUTP pyrophosphatase